MKGIITDAIIVMLIAANIFTGIINYGAAKPKCMCDDCTRVRVSGERYCRKHIKENTERNVCLRVTSKSLN